MRQSKFDQRIRRAEDLAIAYPFAAEILLFYKQVVALQKSIYSFQQAANRNRAANKLSRLAGEHLDFGFLAASFPTFLSAVQGIAPAPIAQSARELNARPASGWSEQFSKLLFGEPDAQQINTGAEALLLIAFLQPYAEFLADHRDPTNGVDGLTRVCPFCTSKPIVGVLRPEGDGAKRSLICSLCLFEWNYDRIRCPMCGEETVEKLAIYTASQFPHVRIDACDTCQGYIKTVDLTKNGLAVPVVDELATLPLNLWAQEHNYVKLQPNLFGI